MLPKNYQTVDFKLRTFNRFIRISNTTTAIQYAFLINFQISHYHINHGTKMTVVTKLIDIVVSISFIVKTINP